VSDRSFFEMLGAAQALLRQQGRVSARALRRQFDLDDEAYADLKAELVEVLRLAREDEPGVLAWAGAPPDPAAAPRALAHDAERRFLTVLFVDLVDATPLSERLDPEQLGEVYKAWQDLCIEVIRVYGGHVAEYRGDGAFIYYGYPVGQEDAPQRAILTGLGVVERLPHFNEALQRSHGVALNMRIGIHSGLVLLSNLGGQYVREQFAVGETPNLAARVQALAGPGEVLVSDAAHAIACDEFDFADLGVRALKGISRPVHVWRALRPQLSHGRGAVRQSVGMVGREPELALLRERWALAMEGHGRAVLLAGEAGIGKTRLVAEHRRHAEGLGARHLVLRCSPYHGATPLYPLAALLQDQLPLGKDDDPAGRAQRLAATLGAAGLDAALLLPFIGPLVGLNAAAADTAEQSPTMPLAAREQRVLMIDALVRWLLTGTRHQPLLLVCEDLQWADATTVQLLGQFIEQIDEERVLAILTCRPDFKPPWPQRSHVSQISLARLSDADALSFAAGALHGRMLDAQALARIVERADGVPLFIEELVHTVADRVDDGNAPVSIPDTLQGSLMARLDREAEVREIAQIGAAAGREFSYALLRAVVGGDESELLRALQRLVDGELLQRRQTPQGTSYRFRHALIRDAAYESTLKSRRAHYHQRIAAALELHFPALAEAQPELLARHLAEAGERARAIELLRVAGERALNRCANEEALAHLGTALALLAQLPDAAARSQLGLRLEVARGAALMMARGQSAPEVEQAYGNARALAEHAGASADLLPALMGLWRFYGARGLMAQARSVAERMHAVALASGHGASLLGARMTLGMTLFHLWEMPRARVLVLEGIEQYRHQPPDDRAIEMVSLGQHPGVACAMCLSFIDMNLGDAAASRAWQEEAVAIAQRLQSPFQLASALGWSTLLHYQRGDDAAFRRAAEAAAQVAETHQFPLWVAVMRVYRGLIQVRDGEVVDGLAQMNSGLAMVDQVRLGLLRLRCLLALAEANLLAGRCDDALAALLQAEAELPIGAEHWWEPEVMRLRGDVLVQRAGPGDAEAAVAAWQAARAVAARRGLAFFEARAAASLAQHA
jgi:class 3 adenylate cyclase